ncbi:MAG: hypothetical protein Q7O66_19785 [Dehalococcoidia bacterium]|nr:hypothetical protein [Dehalococcoidia bacterium]
MPSHDRCDCEGVSRIIPSPKRYGRIYRDITPKDGYGVRKRKREAVKMPLFATDPSIVKSAEEYQEALAESLKKWTETMRRSWAESWFNLRRRIRTLSDSEYSEWLRQWRIQPHSPEYGLDIVTQINRRALRREG